MSERAEVFRVPRATGTHADVLMAAGLADLLGTLPGAERVRILEGQAEFEIHFTGSLTQDDLARVPQSPGYPFLKANERGRIPAGAFDVVDYKAEKTKVDRYKKIAASTGKKRKNDADAEVMTLVRKDQPREDWRLLQVLNTLQGDETANKVHETIVGRRAADFRGDMSAGITALRKRSRSSVGWKVSTVQLFTPTAAKGYSRLKPDSTDRNDKTKDQWADPFTEWLKYRGYFRVACPFFQGDNVRMLCPIPHDISILALESVAREVRKGGVYGGPPKMDSLAVLRLAELLIRHSEEYHDPQAEVFPGLSMRGKSPAQAISGVTTTHYHSLGNAKAVSAISTLALPGWFAIQSTADAEDWLAVLDEHQRIVRGLQDDHCDEIGLLVAYRRFLQGRGEAAAWSLLQFMEHYGPFLIRAREQGRHLRSCRTDLLRRVLMGIAPNLAKVLDDPGFQALATAVRKATVSAQAQKAMGRSDYREIRYGLLHDLRRKRSLPGVAPLMEALSDFVSKYNAENVRRREMRRPAPRNVTTEEFASFTALVERYGASTVGALLCAYGSCREPRDEEGEDVGQANKG